MSEPSPESADRRVREMAELSRRWLKTPDGRQATRERLREVRQTMVTDMTPRAIDARLRTMASLCRLCLALGCAGSRIQPEDR